MFSWGLSSAPTTSNPSVALKQKQLDTLQREHNAMNRGSGIFDIETVNGCIIRVTVPPRFPDEAPKVSLFPNGIKHRIVLEDGTIAVDAWRPHSSLSALVGRLKQIFASEPPGPDATAYNPNWQSSQQQQQQQQVPQYGNPQFAQQQQFSTNTSAAPPQQQQNTIQIPKQQQQQQQQQQQLPGKKQQGIYVSKIPAKFSDLASYPANALELMYHDLDSLNVYVVSLPLVNEAEAAEERLRQDNRTQSAANIELFKTAKELEKTVVAKRAEIDEKTALVESLQERQKSVVNRYSPAVVADLLKNDGLGAKQRAEKLLGPHAAAPPPKDASALAAHVREFINERKMFHLRTLESEQLLRRHPSARLSNAGHS